MSRSVDVPVCTLKEIPRWIVANKPVTFSLQLRDSAGEPVYVDTGTLSDSAAPVANAIRWRIQVGLGPDEAAYQLESGQNPNANRSKPSPLKVRCEWIGNGGKTNTMRLQLQHNSHVTRVVRVSIQGCVESSMFNRWHNIRGSPFTVTLIQRQSLVSSCGWHHVAQNDFGELIAWGSNAHAQLGLGDCRDRRTPAVIPSLSKMNVTSLSCGYEHTVAVLDTGCIFSWGSNLSGQLGVGAHTKREQVPTEITDLKPKHIVSASCGAYHTVALSESGDVFTWGINDRGQLGEEDTSPIFCTPREVEHLHGKSTISVTCGLHHTIALLDGNLVFSWGANENAQLGLGFRSISALPTEISNLRGKNITMTSCGESYSMALLDTGKLLVWGVDPCKTPPTLRLLPVEFVSGLGRVDSVSSGSNHAVLVSGGLLFTTGLNDWGQRGSGNTKPMPTIHQVQHVPKGCLAACCGYASTIAIFESGEAYSWGNNSCGQLSLGKATSIEAPQPISILNGQLDGHMRNQVILLLLIEWRRHGSILSPLPPGILQSILELIWLPLPVIKHHST
ncbi:chromosome condensation regulator [Pelomyxa schiedti]|nr:chromosome condensation regulator [Pelomyxa schiedti]